MTAAWQHKHMMENCSWWWLWWWLWSLLQLLVTSLYVKTHVWTCACVTKSTTSASCSWWWLFYVPYNFMKHQKVNPLTSPAPFPHHTQTHTHTDTHTYTHTGILGILHLDAGVCICLEISLWNMKSFVLLKQNLFWMCLLSPRNMVVNRFLRENLITLWKV